MIEKDPTPIHPFPVQPEVELGACLRQRVRETIEIVLNEELEAALRAKRYERHGERCGHRNGRKERQVVTEHGPLTLSIPRGRVRDTLGREQEWRSAVLPRYQRRTKKVDEALLGAYLGGANSRRIRRALAPILGEAFLSKSAISRVVGRLKERFEGWRSRDLSEEFYAYVYLDAIRLPVRLAKRVVKVPVHAALGVDEAGRKVLLSLSIAGSESTGSWKSIVADLARRGLVAPRAVLLDGNSGLLRAVQEGWPSSEIQRCTKHKLENLLAKAPKHAHGELRRDYREITHGTSAAACRAAYDRFLKKWRVLIPEVARSLEEAGEQLLTFTRFPQAQWKSLRTTNQLERLNGEFRRRTKTQGSFPNETSALVLLYGLIALEQVRLRRIDGWQEMSAVVKTRKEAA